MRRKEPLVTGNTYHIMNKSIAGYSIFNTDSEYGHMIQMLRFFAYRNNLPKFSQFITYPTVKKEGFESSLNQLTNEGNKLVHIIAYCLMPTHIHLILKQLQANGVSIYTGNMLNAYTRYFNTKHNRHGPLWVGRFKNVPIDSDEQLLHLSRYIHLNSVTAGLVDNAIKWKYSSYAEYVTPDKVPYPFCNFEKLINERPSAYRAFVDDRAGYQRQLAKIKKLALE